MEQKDTQAKRGHARGRYTRLAVPMAFAVGLLAASAYGLRQGAIAAEVGAGYTAKLLCSLHFISGQAPEAMMRDYVDGELGGLGFLFSFKVEATSVTATGPLGSHAHAVYRPGHGCTLLAGLEAEEIVRVAPQAAPASAAAPIPSAPRSPAIDDALDAALDAAFTEPQGSEPGRIRATKAVVVLHRGQLVAERYADGYNSATPMLSWSMAKSVIAALVGVLVGDGSLDLAAPAPVPEWSEPSDARTAITLDMLLRQSSGLAFDETYGAVNDVSRMLFTRPDTGAFAAAMPLEHRPDTVWSYSSGTSNIISRIIAERFDRAPDDVAAFAQQRLFEPCGIRSAFFEPDASGTPIGSSFLFMTGRDWARFGELHRNDGICDGRRILPEGWVGYSTKPTPEAPEGEYGAHWWLNAGAPEAPEKRMWPKLPTNVYAALGHSGQYVMVVPDAELVVVRLGLSLPDDGDDGTEDLVAALIETLAAEQSPARSSRATTPAHDA